MKTKIILYGLALLITISGSIVHSQEPKKIYSKIVFQTEDSKGNIDTVVFCVKKKSPEDKEPDNLYGQPPKSDLDMRLIQRKNPDTSDTTNYVWLDDYGNAEIIPYFKSNLDLKFDYRYEQKTLDTNDDRYNYKEFFVIQIYAKHYPIKISIKDFTVVWSKQYNPTFYPTLYLLDGYTYNNKNKCDNKLISGDWHSFLESGSDGKLLTDTVISKFNDSTENKLIGFRIYYTIDGWIADDCVPIILYPNPSSDFITISEGNYGEEFEIVNIDGKIIKKVITENYPYNLDISNLPKGTYFLQNSKGFINKFIKE